MHTVTSRKLGLQILGALLLVNLLLALWVLNSLRESRAQHIRQAEIRTQNLARVLEQTINGTIDRIDLALLAVLDELSQQHQSGRGFDAARSGPLLERHAQRLQGVATLRVADASGA